MKKVKIISVIFVVIILVATIFLLADKKDSPITLTNENADEKTVQLYSYISQIRNKHVLSGQQESTWMGSADYETDFIYNATGKLPAIKGFDYMNDDFQGVNRRAYDWHKKGGIVTICWHCGSDFSGEWKDCMESEFSEKMLEEGTDEYKSMIAGMDKAASALKELEEKGVPVLWRPFHEFDGTWFWWSKNGSESFKKMWQIMYDRYTNHWKLNNLIWVLGFSDQGKKSKNWYPGDEYCDIIGADTYTEGLFSKLYKKMNRITNADKPVCLHECGKNPTTDELNKAPFVWFMTWHTEYLTDNNSKENLKQLYDSELVITLDKINR